MGKKKSSTPEVENQPSKISYDNLFVDDDDNNGEDVGSADDGGSEASDESLPKSNKRVADDEEIEGTKKKKFKRDKDLFKQPTVEELNQLRETETLFHSNLFRLQIEEVLNATKVKDKYRKLFDAWFEKFKKSVLSIAETEEFSIKSAAKTLQGVKVPKPKVPIDKKGVFKFLKPSDVRVIGSYALGCVTGPNIVIDIMTEMPSKFFQKLDYQNYRYTRKRALYLSWLSMNIDQQLSSSKKFVGNSWTPLLRIIPCGQLGKKVTIHVHLAAAEDSFKLSRFLPQKNSVRPGWYFGEEDTESESLVPTPHYNSIVLRDLTMSQTNARCAKIVGEYPNVRDGIILLKIWLRQRQLNVSHGSFNNHIMTMYVLYLLSEKKLNTFMSSYQIVRNVWINLALSDWSGKGVTMCPDSETSLDDYRKYYDCVFLDTSGYHNLASHLSIDNYRWIRSEAERAVKSLDDPNLDSFQALFMRPLPFYRMFDNLICFNNVDVIEKIVEDQSPTDDKLDYGPDRRTQAIKLISAVLKEGLGKRISNLYVGSEAQSVWDVTESPPENIGKIMIGLSLDPEHCFTIIDKGPHANLPEAAVFRKFWGNKSELRRFQDGSICEALVWAKGKKTLSVKRIICKKIVRFLLKEKFDLSKEQYVYVADETDEFLQVKKIKGTTFAYGTGEEATLQVLRAFGALEKELTSLADLPLSISGVQGYSPVFRYTEVFPPLVGLQESCEHSLLTRPSNMYSMLKEGSPGSPVHVPRHVPRIEASLQLLMSGKWPDELEAVKKTKAAFHIQIAECLRKQCNLQAQANTGWVDVLKEGFVFRLEVAHQKEIALMKREIGEDRVQKYRDNEESVELEKRLFHLPKLSSALHGLHSQQPSFGPTCCLAKRWLSSHLLDESHMPGVVVELLVASIYLTPDPYKAAQTPQVAFLRFLEFFARRHWTTEPIFVNFNNEMSREEIVAVENAFRATGDSRPPVFISIPYDHDQSIWSKIAPTTLILNRIGSLAERALKLIDEQFDGAVSDLSFHGLFRAPITEYDCVIRLHSSFVPRRWQYHDIAEKYPVIELHKIDESSAKKIPVADFDPVQRYLYELRRGYDEVALFFHDTYGGSAIAVLLKPIALEAREFKIANMSCRKLNDDGKLVLDVAAMIEGFTILGKGLVKCIDLQSKRVELD